MVRTVLLQCAMKKWRQWLERQSQLLKRWSVVCATVKNEESTKRQSVITQVVTAAKVCARLRTREETIRCSRGGGQPTEDDSESPKDAAASSCNIRTKEGAKLGGILCVFILALIAGGGRWAVRKGVTNVTENIYNNRYNIWRHGERKRFGQRTLVKTFGNECTRQRIRREQSKVAIEECGEREPG